MRTSIVVSGLMLVMAASASPVSAQVQSSRESADSARIAAVLRSSAGVMHPAELVLAHRDELALTPEQVTRLESIAAAQRDSAAPRQRRMMEIFRGDVAGRGARPGIMGWSGPIDEEAIREEGRRAAERQAEVLLGIVRDRHAAGAVLTPTQLAMLPRLEGAAMVRGMSPTPEPSTLPQGEGHPYFEFQVEKQVVSLRGSRAPIFPPELRAAKVEGEVLAQFVVDTTGRFEPGSFRVLRSSHGLFTQAVRDALPEMRFAPAEIGGHKVRQVVQQPFTFALSQNEE